MKLREMILMTGALVLVCGIAPRAAETASDGERTGAAAERKAEKPMPKEMARYEKALARLERSTDVQGMVGAMKVLREGFPGSRGVLHRCVERGSVKTRGFALQVLGERGEAARDLDVVVKALEDHDKRIRLAAIMALRSLGQEKGEGLEALRKHLPGETDPNNRKMLVKAFQYAADEDAVPVLIRTLGREKEKGVKNFIIIALEAITGKKLGDDVEAWQNWLEVEMLKKQAEKLIHKDTSAQKEAE